MQDGDISNVVAPRFVIIFEGLIGRLESPVDQAKEETYRRLHRWKKAAQCWTIDSAVVARMWDLMWRHDIKVDVATYVPQKYADAIFGWMGEHGVPSGDCIVTNPNALAKRLSYMPYVRRVFYREPERPFIYGDRGVFVRGSFDPWM